MNGNRIKIGTGAILSAALIYFFAEPEMIAAIILPIIAHESGHVILLRAMGLRVHAFRAELKGFCIEYSGWCGYLGQTIAAAAGPAAGVGYAFAASRLGAALVCDWLILSAGISMLLSIFNLLPALPLDGGHIFLCLVSPFIGDRKAMQLVQALGMAIGFCLLVLGMWLLWKGGGPAVEIAAVWLLLSQPEGLGIVNRKELL